MNLPHLAPMLFAKEVLELKKKEVLVKCSFPYVPSLAMLCEAAAQSSAAFLNEEKDKPEIGFLINIKNVLELKVLKECECIVKVIKNVELENMSEYDFEVIFNNRIYSKGTLTVVIPSKI
ncbi:MAG: hypothetical protein HRT41_14405 [Campylobacteraceae bacterium]|nr:hypothetical protein [Campylobacteraceae bacterium]